MSFTFSIAPTGRGLRPALEQVAGDIGLDRRVGHSVFIKPNFTFPRFKPGVTTTRELLTELVSLLKDAGCGRICLGEGEGGYNSFSMDEAFEGFRMAELTERFGLEVVNVARWPSTKLRVQSRHGSFIVPVPRPLFEEFDAFITVPVPKVHSQTTVSNAVKNQWGLIQDVMRLRLHVAFDEIVTEINRRLPTAMAIVDGTFGLTRSGPVIEGVELDLGWVSACDHLWLNDKLVCELMGIPLATVSHLRHAQTCGLVPEPEDYVVKGDFESFCDDRFYLKPNVWTRSAKLTWRSRRLNHLVYFSKVSGLLHQLMYSVRSKPDELRSKGIDWR